MALKTISQYRDSVAALLSGVDIGQIDNLYGAFERAARTLTQQANVPEASSKENFVMYEGVVNYPLDPRCFGDSIRDIRPITRRRSPSDFVYKQTNDDFDRDKDYVKQGTIATVIYDNGDPVLRCVSVHTPAQLPLDLMNDLTGWAAGGDASGLAKDVTYYYNAPASLRFNLSASGSEGWIEKTLANPIDGSAFEGVGVVFLAVEIPATAPFDSFSVRIGSSSSDYYEIDEDTQFLGAFVSDDFMLVAFELAGVSPTGSPDFSAISYLRASASYDGTAVPNVRFGGMWMSLPTPMQNVFTTAAIFKPAEGGEARTTIMQDSDQILLSDPAYTIYEYEGALSVIAQTGGNMTSPTVKGWIDMLHNEKTGLYTLFNGNNPSNELRTVGSWYGNTGYRYGRRR